MDIAYAHGVFPLVYHALKLHTELIPAGVLQAMKSHNMDIVKQNMLMTAELIKVMKLLEENDIEAFSYKGPLLAQMAYGDITLRQYVDLDILISENQLDKIIQLLIKNNYTINKSEYKNIMRQKSIFHDVSIYSKNNVHIELHWKLFSDEFKTDLEHVNIKDNFSEVTISGYSFQSFEIELLLLYLCIHGAKHNWERVEWLVDITKLIQNHTIDWIRLTKLVKITKTEKIFFSTLFLCKTILNLELTQEIESKLKEKKLLQLSEEFEEHFYKNFKRHILQKIQTKNISKIQYKLLNGYKSKLAFIFSLLKPTELEFASIRLPRSLYFLYFIIRPFNIAKRWIKKI